MSIKLKNLKFFADLEQRLERITRAQIEATVQGLSFPTGEPVAGVLPDTAIALLALHEQAASARDAAIETYLGTDQHEDTDGTVRRTVIEADHDLKLLGALIRTIIREEFPVVKDWRSFGIGPHFEVHHVTLSTIDITDDTLDTLLARIIGSDTLDFARKR